MRTLESKPVLVLCSGGSAGNSEAGKGDSQTVRKPATEIAGASPSTAVRSPATVQSAPSTSELPSGPKTNADEKFALGSRPSEEKTAALPGSNSAEPIP